MDQMGDARSPSIRLRDNTPKMSSQFKPKVVIKTLAQAEHLAKNQMSSNSSSTPGIQKVKKLDFFIYTWGSFKQKSEADKYNKKP